LEIENDAVDIIFATFHYGTKNKKLCNHSVSVIIYNTQRKAYFSTAKFKPQNASYICTCFHLHLAFHDFYNAFVSFKENGKSKEQKQQN